MNQGIPTVNKFMRDKIASLVFFSIIILSFSACDETVITPEKITVNGQVGYDIGFSQNATVEISGIQSMTNEIGEFSFEKVNTPYDIKIVSQNKKYAYIFEGLSSNMVELNIAPGGIDFGNTGLAYLKVNVPLSDSMSRKLLVGFIPDDPNLELAVFPDIQSGLNNIQLIIHPNYGSQFTGRLALLYYTKIAENIISYDRFYEKHNITLTTGTTTFDTISGAVPYFNPPETNVSGFVNNYYSAPSNSRLKIGYRNNFSSFYDYIHNFNISTDFNFTVPSGLPEEFQITVGSFYALPQSSGTSTYLRVLPGSSGNQIYLHPALNIVKPNEMESVQLYGMKIEINDPEPGEGIYQASISYENPGIGNSINIFSGNPVVTVPDLTSLGFNYTPGETYKVVIRKLYSFNSIDEFASSNYTHGNLYNGIVSSQERSFIAQ